MTSPELSVLDYLREIEHLANRVKMEASGEGWLSFQAAPEEPTPLQRSVNALARTLRSYHFEGDGCTEEDRPLWNTWSDGGELKVTMGVPAVETTEGLLENWSRVRAIDPAFHPLS